MSDSKPFFQRLQGHLHNFIKFGSIYGVQKRARKFHQLRYQVAQITSSHRQAALNSQQ
jgi:hypothetical protein